MNHEKYQENILFPDITSEIKTMYDVDQAMRERSLNEEDYWDEEIDARNTERMKEIVAKIGFPTVSKVGKEGASNAWLLVQHADHDVKFQRECLKLMKEAPLGEVDKTDIAYLEDRVRVNQGIGQLYGTQFTQENNKHVPLPIEDEENIDKRRLENGMDTLIDQIQYMNDKYPLKK